MGFYEFAFHAPDTSRAHPSVRGVHRMLPGKVPPEILKNIVFSHLGVLDPSVLLGPRLGEDASLIQIGDKVVIVSTDPITGSVEDIGWLVVNINANDIATFGVAPRWLLVSIMLPSGYEPQALAKIMKQIDEASKELDIAVVGGHSEITERIDRPLIVGFMMGVTDKDQYITSSGARTGDAILLTKTVGIEGTAILASEGYASLSKNIGLDVINDGLKLKKQISVVKDGVVAFGTGHIHAMHDSTEGGFACGIHELCDASKVGFEINANDIPISRATRLICEFLEINPLELIGSGAMIMTCSFENASEVIRVLESEGITASYIGKIVSDPDHRKIQTNDSFVDMPRPKSDELWRALKKVNPA